MLGAIQSFLELENFRSLNAVTIVPALILLRRLDPDINVVELSLNISVGNVNMIDG